MLHEIKSESGKKCDWRVSKQRHRLYMFILVQTKISILRRTDGIIRAYSISSQVLRYP